MLKRIKNLWKLGEFKIDPETENPQFYKHGQLIRDIPLGDGKAEFIGAGTEEEFKEQQREDKGLKGIFGIGKH